MKILKAIQPVFINGVVIDPGEKFSCDETLAEKFIESKAAKSIVEKDKADSQKNELLSLTKEELLKIVEEKGIEGVSQNTKKEDIVDTILHFGESQ
ncbi:hypothetical protein BTO30_14905 [Domibacillus antri]|uniref:Uncharacterized protein n=1 Tax=Domibacillus antri TaxID=1714264 RepID=A0A1Q8Q264_9BACI|nr:hypothetical protein [Domibacillus antri]OLN21407.1 hypothetical protein BTO30_14905 [Domibacillus antri]